ncbi:phage_term_2, phage terminase, large subunit, PBSX family [uncultured Caudovirales phage]|uniref:Phage_term_2, phage terminase, large subunit, PBSX family n=1 Tax=uncultured Caudovirales phage TaxID=2100421 RepID=A0A6J5NDZ5_9CAUD|nr:phage_term_2, phage terminase, large subunit, PBSX family [uncultured Caudovirales phage]
MKYEPTFLDRQKEALNHLSISSPIQQVLYGGGAGGGKTKLGCIWTIQRRLKYAGTRSLIGRSKLDTLKKTTLNTFFETCAEMQLKSGLHYTFNGQANIIKFFNGSEIILKDLFSYPADKNFDSLGSLEITDYFCDEVSEISEKAIAIVHSRCRFKLNEYDLIPKGLLTCNPSKNWIYNEFYLKAKNDELPEHRAFVQALPTDNPFLPASYLESLRLLPDYDRKRLLLGNWEYDDDSDKIFSSEHLNIAFRNEILSGIKYITCDVARFGKDRTIICVWNGLSLLEIKELKRSSITDTYELIESLRKEHQIMIQNIICDEDGIGGGLCDIGKYKGFQNGSKAKHPDRFVNIKAECFFKLAEYIEKNKITFLANDWKEQIISELQMIKRHKADSDSKLAVTPKDVIKLREGKSPDIADAIMMRMYYELNANTGKYVFA